MRACAAWLLAFALLAGCRGESAPNASTPPDGRRRVTPARISGAPVARLFAGTEQGSDMVEGAVRRWCVRGKCAGAAGRAARALSTTPGEFIVLALGRTPTSATLEVRGPDGTRAVRALAPSTTMGARAPESPGRYTLALEAGWKDGSARWLFALTVQGPKR